MNTQAISWRRVGRHWQMYLFLFPALLLIGLFQYYPAASGVFHSFFRWNGADISEYVGLENYRDLARSAEFWASFRVALILGFWNVLKMIPAVLVAVCIHRCRSPRLQYVYRALFVVPMVIPGLVIALVWRSFFFEATSGYLNRFLMSTHLFDLLCWLDRALGWGGVFTPGVSPSWLGDPRLILAACIIWGFPWVGSFAVLTHLAKLQGISKDIYEAAEIDGVSWFSKFIRIELPLIMGSIYLLLVLVVIDTLKDAGMILALAGMEGGPGGKVTVPALFMIRKAFTEQAMGYACAVGIVLTLSVVTLQRASALVMHWPSFGPGRRWLLRGVFLPAGLVLFYTPGFVWAGGGLLALCLPWAMAARILRLLWRHGRRIGRPAALWRGMSAGRRPRRRSVLLDRASWWMLRGTKHAVIWLVLGFSLLPLYLMLIVSLKSNPQFYEAPTTLTTPYHWENWRIAWIAITPTLANSVFVSLGSTFLTLALALSAAYFFARYRMPLSGLLWNALLILMMMPTIANLVPLFRLLGDLHLLNTLLALVLVGTAAGQVFAIFVLRSFVADIPQALFEAAEMDGAGHVQQLYNVVLPMSWPILGTIGVMHFIGVWNEFVLPLIVMRDHARLPVMVQLLRMAGEYIKLWGPLMAGYALASIPVILLFLFSMRLFVRGLTEGAIKE